MAAVFKGPSGMNRRHFLGTACGVMLALYSGTEIFAEDASPSGVWEGPWYRGMTSGKVKIDLRQSARTIQFTNLDGFGTQATPLEASLEGDVLKMRAQGEQGGPLSANLKLNEDRTQMKGLGKFDGFPLRFELKRANSN
jgi:hypothetical protein